MISIVKIRDIFGRTVEKEDGTVVRETGNFGSVWSINFPCGIGNNAIISSFYYDSFVRLMNIHRIPSIEHHWNNVGGIVEDLPQFGWVINDSVCCSNDGEHPIFLIGKCDFIIPEIEKSIKIANKKLLNYYQANSPLIDKNISNTLDLSKLFVEATMNQAEQPLLPLPEEEEEEENREIQEIINDHF